MRKKYTWEVVPGSVVLEERRRLLTEEEKEHIRQLKGEFEVETMSKFETYRLGVYIWLINHGMPWSKVPIFMMRDALDLAEKEYELLKPIV